MAPQLLKSKVNSPVHLSLPWALGQDSLALRSREWLVTNGLGGYASGTLIGENSRRYHGLLVPSLPSIGRTMMLAQCDEILKVNGQLVQWGGAEYANDTRDGKLEDYLREFRLEWTIPTWYLEIEGRRIRKQIVMAHEQNTIYVVYTLLDGPSIDMLLRPYMTFRGHDTPLAHPPEWAPHWENTPSYSEFKAFPKAPILRLGVAGSPHTFDAFPIDHNNIYYRIEKERGLDYLDSLHSPGYFSASLSSAASLAFIASLEAWSAVSTEAERVVETEQTRVKKLLDQASPAAQSGWGAHLTLAADQFIVKPGKRLTEHVLPVGKNRPSKSVIAGYHWFTDWGRDTMISLEGLTLRTGQFEEAKEILYTFAKYVHKGLLPNHFPEGQPVALYHTLDASLWYFHAVDRYQKLSKDKTIIPELFGVLRDIIQAHLEGTSYGIHTDPEDGLLCGSTSDRPLTWMDAQVDGYVATPRRGKPVEIQGLWYNALSLMSGWANYLGQPHADYDEVAQKAYVSFNRKFWNEQDQCLFDLLNDDGHPDSSLRPNQLFTFSLMHPILVQDKWEPVLRKVHDHLLTPWGVRTLDPRHAEYQSRYEGNRRARDGAYHQGMVWAWLIGPYLDAWLKVYPDRKKALFFLNAFETHLRHAGMGSISEIFDGDQPHAPRGCIAQAWSVAEILRQWCNLVEEPPVS